MDDLGVPLFLETPKFPFGTAYFQGKTVSPREGFCRIPSFTKQELRRIGYEPGYSAGDLFWDGYLPWN